jgi:hypothetical protein
MALAAGQIFGDYEIIAGIGRGGMGTVYQARQISLQRVVALKVLPPHLADDADFQTRFQTEAIAAAGLNHPNIVQVFAAGEHDGIRFIAMEFVEGESIQARVKRLGRLPLTEALDAAYHVAVALAHAWDSGQLIHRDVKPDNIFLSTHGTVKLGDFGLAKVLREGASSVTLTGAAMGSPHFISPEQAHGQRDVDLRADVYSLGCTLHYMMTGRMVFEGPDFVSIVLKHVSEPPAPLHTLLRDCPSSLERLLDRMLAKERGKRHQAYAELVEELVAARAEAAVWESGDTRLRRKMAAPPPGRTSSRTVYVVAALLALTVAAGMVWTRRASRAGAVARRAVTLVDPSDRRDFIESVRKLQPLERVERVMMKMREVNPGFDGKEKYTVEDDVITELTFSTVGVTNLWPVCALPHLRALTVTGDAQNKRRGDLVDLSPLRELLELEQVDCSWNPVAELRPLAGLPLKGLHCAGTRVADLAPLKGMGLTELDVSSTAVQDIAPLAKAPLTELRCQDTRLRDLSPLRNAPIKMIWCDPRALHPDLLRSWKELEAINGAPPHELLRKLRPRVGGP